MITRKVIVILTLVMVVGIYAKPKEEMDEPDGNDSMVKNAPMDGSKGKLPEDNNTVDAEEDKSDDLAEEDPKEASIDVDEEEDSKKSVKNFTCKVTGAILSMAQSIMELNKDIKAIKNQMFEKCPGFNASETDSLDALDSLNGSVDALSTTSDKTNLEEDGEDGAEDKEEKDKDELPPIPTECDEPFQPVANSCYYFLYYPPDWKTWGDANAYCQTFGGTLAAPYRYEDLRNYLTENFSNVFWVGAKKSTTKKETK
ncbi:hypothetical protein Anas_05976 [Armadillidium nasatum]|uniref:C-type lectin domain-containing protein n=1 Tax=Armadillidium nasatum TaxID=96803 RepID=A0A5N5TD46_9CRUS|nr:hypothetical protein Anas_05976 [Armadillidium nasatum]